MVERTVQEEREGGVETVDGEKGARRERGVETVC